jgi:hypothetical protein
MVEFNEINGVLILANERESRGHWKFQLPLVPQLKNLDVGLLVGIVFRSPIYFYRPPPMLTREDISDFYHCFDDE